MPGFCNGSLRDEATHAICILCQTTFLRNLSNLLDALWINHASFVLSASKLDNVTVQCLVASARIRYIFVLPENAKLTVSLAGFH